MAKKCKEKYVGTTYDVFLDCGDKGKTSITLLGKNVKDVKKQAKKIYVKKCKITKVKKITKNYRCV